MDPAQVDQAYTAIKAKLAAVIADRDLHKVRLSRHTAPRRAARGARAALQASAALPPPLPSCSPHGPRGSGRLGGWARSAAPRG